MQPIKPDFECAPDVDEFETGCQVAPFTVQGDIEFELVYGSVLALVNLRPAVTLEAIWIAVDDPLRMCTPEDGAWMKVVFLHVVPEPTRRVVFTEVRREIDLRESIVPSAHGDQLEP